MENAQLVSIVEAAQRLGVGRSMIYELLGEGSLPSIRLGTRRLIPVKALDELIEKRMAEKSA